MGLAPLDGAQDLVENLRRLKLATIREEAAEVLQNAKTQRLSAEDVLRTLVTAEINGRDAANRRIRLKQAGFPALKTLETLNLTTSSIPRPTFEYLGSLEWIRAAENALLVGPAGTGKSHCLIGLGYRAIERGLRVRYFAAADLVEALYRGLADNSAGKLMVGILRNDLVLIDELGFAPLDETGRTHALRPRCWIPRSGVSCPRGDRERRCVIQCVGVIGHQIAGG